MSLTQVNHVFAGIYEHGINVFLTAFLKARPRLINYGSPFFVPVTTVFATSLPAFSFPGVPGSGIEYAVSFSIPVIDLFPPDSSGVTTPLPPGPGQLTLQTDVTLTIACIQNERVERAFRFITPLSTTLDVLAKGEPTVTTVTIPIPFVGSISFQAIGFQLDEVKLPDLGPQSLEIVLECLLRMILQALLENVKLPVQVVTIRAIKLLLERGPLIEDDQIKLYGDVL